MSNLRRDHLPKEYQSYSIAQSFHGVCEKCGIKQDNVRLLKSKNKVIGPFDIECAYEDCGHKLEEFNSYPSNTSEFIYRNVMEKEIPNEKRLNQFISRYVSTRIILLIFLTFYISLFYLWYIDIIYFLIYILYGYFLYIVYLSINLLIYRFGPDKWVESPEIYANSLRKNLFGPLLNEKSKIYEEWTTSEFIRYSAKLLIGGIVFSPFVLVKGLAYGGIYIFFNIFFKVMYWYFSILTFPFQLIFGVGNTWKKISSKIKQFFSYHHLLVTKGISVIGQFKTRNDRFLQYWNGEKTKSNEDEIYYTIGLISMLILHSSVALFWYYKPVLFFQTISIIINGLNIVLFFHIFPLIFLGLSSFIFQSLEVLLSYILIIGYFLFVTLLSKQVASRISPHIDRSPPPMGVIRHFQRMAKITLPKPERDYSDLLEAKMETKV